jgi:hypothetical protein
MIPAVAVLLSESPVFSQPLQAVEILLKPVVGLKPIDGQRRIIEEQLANGLPICVFAAAWK